MSATVKYLQPREFSGSFGAGEKGVRDVVVMLTCISTGTDETLVEKVDLSALRNSLGVAPSTTSLLGINYTTSGFTNIELLWDRAPKERMFVIGGNTSHSMEFGSVGGIKENSDGSSGSGNILLSTTGASAGDSYVILLHLRLN